MGVNYGDVYDAVARAVEPADAAIYCDGAVTTWGELDHATNAFARALIASGLEPGAKLACYMRNGPAYVTAFIAAFKARLAPVNMNYRYGVEEVAYLLDNSDSACVVFDAAFADIARALVGRLAHVKLWVCADERLEGFSALEDLIRGDGAPLGIERSGEDLLLLYTGGTTGLPKGVMWPQETWWEVLAAGRAPVFGMDPPQTIEALQAQIRTGQGRAPVYVAPPLMHGTGMFSAFGALSKGAPIAVTRSAHFDAGAALDVVTNLRCGGFIIVGDAFAKPLLDALRADPARFDATSIRTMTSSGMMWSPEVKEGLLEFMPDAMLFDSFGASEATGLGGSITTRDMPAREARFDAPNTVVLRADENVPLAPGTGEVGRVAKWGNLPLGYYKDPEKTARTYVTIDGVRFLISGDHATLEADGTIKLLGRGSHCINSGGEKIYPEEVEEALKTHPAVADALVFGVPDQRFGQSVAAVVGLNAGACADEAALAAHVRAQLAPYKAPRRIVFAPAAPRAPNGKADYAAAKALFAKAVEVA